MATSAQQLEFNPIFKQNIRDIYTYNECLNHKQNKGTKMAYTNFKSGVYHNFGKGETVRTLMTLLLNIVLLFVAQTLFANDVVAEEGKTHTDRRTITSEERDICLSVLRIIHEGAMGKTLDNKMPDGRKILAIMSVEKGDDWSFYDKIGVIHEKLKGFGGSYCGSEILMVGSVAKDILTLDIISRHKKTAIFYRVAVYQQQEALHAAEGVEQKQNPTWCIVAFHIAEFIQLIPNKIIEPESLTLPKDMGIKLGVENGDEKKIP